LDTNRKGKLAETKSIARFLEKGEIVLTPVTDERYDLVLDRGEHFIRVQCKMGHIKDGGVIEFNSSSVDRKSYRGDADYFSVYVPKINTLFMVPVGDVSESKGYLRLVPPANNQKKDIRYMYKYIY